MKNNPTKIIADMLASATSAGTMHSQTCFAVLPVKVGLFHVKISEMVWEEGGEPSTDHLMTEVTSNEEWSRARLELAIAFWMDQERKPIAYRADIIALESVDGTMINIHNPSIEIRDPDVVMREWLADIFTAMARDDA